VIAAESSVSGSTRLTTSGWKSVRAEFPVTVA
jgi:hypothetical protein